MGEIAGVSWIEVDDSGFLDYQLNHGFHRDLDTSIRISIDADNIASIALRTQRTQISDLRSAPSKFEDHTHAESLEAYSSVLILPLTPVTALGIVFISTPVELSKFQDYFECVRLILSLKENRIRFDESRLSSQSPVASRRLTSRQAKIVELIRDGKTNGSIADSLGYSESLIRQETIIIYRKLGVSGRKEL